MHITAVQLNWDVLNSSNQEFNRVVSLIITKRGDIADRLIELQ